MSIRQGDERSQVEESESLLAVLRRCYRCDSRIKTNDLPAETPVVREGDSALCPGLWGARGIVLPYSCFRAPPGQGWSESETMSSPPACHLALVILWWDHCTPTMFLAPCWALYRYYLVYTHNSLFSFLFKKNTGSQLYWDNSWYTALYKFRVHSVMIWCTYV